MGEHISQQFDAELESVRTKVLAMGGLVEKQLRDAVRSVLESDDELGRRVMDGDRRVNAMEGALDEDCALILARRQPAARDLRMIMAMIKITANLERMGDEAERIGRMAVALSERNATPQRQPFASVRHLGEQVKQLLHEALDALARADAMRAAELVADDRKVDGEYEAVMRQLITYMMEDPRQIHHCLEVMWSARALERIADRACNICQYVVYLAHGSDVRHMTPEQIVEEVQRQDRESA